VTSGDRDSNDSPPWEEAGGPPAASERPPAPAPAEEPRRPPQPEAAPPPPAPVEPLELEEEDEDQLPTDADPLLRIHQEKESKEISQLRESGRMAMHLLAQLLRNYQLYGPENVIFERPLAEFDQVLKTLIGRLGEVRLIVVEGQPYVGDLRIRVDSASISNVTFLGHWLGERGLGGWCFGPPPSFEAVQAFLALVARSHFGRENRLAHVRDWLDQAGIGWIEPIPPQRYREEGEEELDTSANPKVSHLYDRGLSAVRGFFGMLGKTGVGPVLDARKAVQYMVDMAIEDQPDSLAMSMMAEFDDPLLSHSMHVANLSVAIGASLKVPRSLLAELGLCGLLHDTGFCDLPEDLTGLSGRDSEATRIAEHSVLGFRLQIRQRGYHLGRLFRGVVNLEHHLEAAGARGEPWDNPKRPIHPFSRIVAVADAYDTLVTDTASRPALLPTQAIRQIWRGRKSRFDPVVAQTLVNIMGLYPFGSVLQLSDGSVAVVVAQGRTAASFERPRVRGVRDGDQVAGGQYYDLSRISTSDLAVVGVLDPREHGIDLLAALFAEG